MRRFLTRLFVVFGVFFFLSMMISGLAAWSMYEAFTAKPETPDKMVIALDFTKPISESIANYDFQLSKILYEEDEPTPLVYIVRALEKAKDDPRVKGVIARFGSEPIPFAHVQELVAAIDAFRKTGKFSYAYAYSYGDFTSAGMNYLLASSFEHIWMQPIGSVGITNMGIEAPFGKSALEKIGVQSDFLRREEYKSVMENIARDSFSEPVRANMNSMLSNLNEQMAAGIGFTRRIDLAKAKSIISSGPYTSQESLQSGLVTKLAYQDEFYDELEKVSGKDAEPVDVSSYLAFLSEDTPDQENTPRIALIIADGMIVEDAPKGPSRFTDDEVIDTEEIVQAFEDASDDITVKAILFRVNSPGGSPVASETIRRAIIKAQEKKKPVYVSMGRVAASGGYWISMNATKIIADPATLTGSIGVVAGKMVLGGLFDKLGIKWDTLSMGDNAHYWSPRAPFSEAGRARMNAMLDETYQTFTQHVAAARKIEPGKIADIAKGRVFTGQQAATVGLVDHLGGYNTAIEIMRKDLNIATNEQIIIEPFPQPETPASLAMKILKDFGFGASVFQNLYAVSSSLRVSLSPYIQALRLPEGPAAYMPLASWSNGL